MILFTCKAKSYDGAEVFGWPITVIEANGNEWPALFQPYGRTYIKVVPGTITRLKPDRAQDYIDGAVELLKEYTKIPKEERGEN